MLLMSYFFYACWVPKYLLPLVFSTIVTWSCGFFLERATKSRARKLMLAMTIIVNLAILFTFKYFNFFGDIVGTIMQSIGIEVNMPRVSLLLPVGISFYTFQALGYSIDVYRGDIKHERNLLEYALFVSFFRSLLRVLLRKVKIFCKRLMLGRSDTSSI